MTSTWTELGFDCADPERMAEFWCAVLGWTVVDHDQVNPFAIDDKSFRKVSLPGRSMRCTRHLDRRKALATRKANAN